MPHYTPGDSVSVRGLFKDGDKIAVDPDAVQYTSVAPDGTTDIKVYLVDDIIRQAAGDYVTVQNLDQEGVYFVEWKATGQLQTVEQTTITVYPSVI